MTAFLLHASFLKIFHIAIVVGCSIALIFIVASVVCCLTWTCKGLYKMGPPQYVKKTKVVKKKRIRKYGGGEGEWEEGEWGEREGRANGRGVGKGEERIMGERKWRDGGRGISELVEPYPLLAKEDVK